MNVTNATTSEVLSQAFTDLSRLQKVYDSALEQIATLSEAGASNATQILEKISARRLECKQEVCKGVLFQDDVPPALAFLEINGEDSELRLICGLSYWVIDDLRPAAEDQLRLSNDRAASLALDLLAVHSDGNTVTGLEDVQESPFVCAVLGDAFLYGIGVNWNLQCALKHYLGAAKSAPDLVARRLAIVYDAIGYTNRAQEFWTYIDNALSSESSSSTSTNSTSS